jgi:hypothetical protein
MGAKKESRDWRKARKYMEKHLESEDLGEKNTAKRVQAALDYLTKIREKEKTK